MLRVFSSTSSGLSFPDFDVARHVRRVLRSILTGEPRDVSKSTETDTSDAPFRSHMVYSATSVTSGHGKGAPEEIWFVTFSALKKKPVEEQGKKN